MSKLEEIRKRNRVRKLTETEVKPDVVLVVPYKPISENHMYGQRGHRKFLKKEGKEYKEKIVALCEREKIELDPGRIVIEVVYYFGDRRRRDVTNYNKAHQDAFSGTVYNDDVQVSDFIARKRYDKENPRTEISIWRI